LGGNFIQKNKIPFEMQSTLQLEDSTLYRILY